jgi:hypothetical protein
MALDWVTHNNLEVAPRDPAAGLINREPNIHPFQGAATSARVTLGRAPHAEA